MFESFRKSAETAAINALLGSDTFMTFVNAKARRYAEIRSVKKTDRGYEAVVRLHGSAESLTIIMRELSISEDGSTVRLAGFSSDTEWLDHVLADFAEGRCIGIPESCRSMAGMARKILTRTDGGSNA